jgi:hypothetical protein
LSLGRLAALFGSVLAVGMFVACGGRAADAPDPIASDIARWKRFLAEDTVTVGFVSQVKRAAAPMLTSADTALARGRRAVALLRLGSVRANLEPAFHPATRANVTLEEVDAERAKLAPRFAPDALQPLMRPAGTSALGLALAQASAMQARQTFDASPAYGQATEPLFGMYYLAQGVSYLDYASFAARAGAPLRSSGARTPKLRSLAPEVRALRDEMLAAYRPPLSIDRHPEYIGASSATKEALEYDTDGLREAALLRYLLAALRFAPLRASAAPLEAATLATKLDAARKRLAEPGVDHSIGSLFLEVAASDADTASADSAGIASAIVDDVLPRYFAALGPAPAAAAAQRPEVNVTLVRWPYT